MRTWLGVCAPRAYKRTCPYNLLKQFPFVIYSVRSSVGNHPRHVVGWLRINVGFMTSVAGKVRLVRRRVCAPWNAFLP